MMKRFLTVIIMGLGAFANASAQTAINKQTPVPSSVLDFPENQTKGIILPAVTTLPATPADGTFLFDANATQKKVKMFENGIWKELSGVGDITRLVPYSGTVDNGKQTIIGSRETGADGVLVLESSDKALVLPKISNPHLNVKSPYPGMMCYDTDRKALAVFDGTFWNYWK